MLGPAKLALIVLAAVALITLSSCPREKGPEGGPAPSPAKVRAEKEEEVSKVAKLKLSSPAFEHGQPIPSRYTADGEDINPPLVIEGIPPGTKSLVLIMDDPDAPIGLWVHWVVFNIPPDTTRIEEGEEPPGTPGLNSWRRTGYGGPAPPSGTHRYFFRVYALDTVLDLPEGAGKRQVEHAMEGHILAMGELMGTYSRKR